ncbi:MAG: fumarylacetoacetate hydrolase family protein [Flavobacteriales bacterium]|nr:fumarylacetoacetate hydrolase family protein [Flavobacteriales bacterium]
MKLVCIGRNYRAHAAELGNAVPGEPVIFLKPSTALVPPGEPIPLPPFSREVHHEVEVVVAIGKRCRNVSARDAMDYVEGLTIGLDLTARDVQEELKRKGLPWEKAKAYDGSAVVAQRRIGVGLVDLEKGVDFRLLRNGAVVQQGRTNDMVHPIPDLIAYASKYMTLEPGDLLFTGTPEGVGPLAPGDKLDAFLGEEHLLSISVAD